MSAQRHMGPRVGGRQLVRLGLELSERDLAVLCTAMTFRLASARQLELLHFEGATELTRARTARRVLKRLADARLLSRLERRVGGLRSGSAGQVFALGPVGHRLLAEEAPGARPRRREPSPAFHHHTLAITELYVRCQVEARGAGIELVGVEAEPRCWRPFATTLGMEHLRPDLRLHLRLQDGDELHWFIEVDRGTEHAPAIGRKVRQYLTYYQSGIEQAGTGGIFPAVLYVTDDEQRVMQLERAVGRVAGLPAGLVQVTTTEAAVDQILGEVT